MKYDITPIEPASPWRLAPAIYLLDAIRRVEGAGCDMTQFLRSAGLSRRSLESPGKFVTKDQYYNIISYCVHELETPEVGFIQEDSLPLLSTGVAGLALITSETVGDVFRLVQNHPGLLALPVSVKLTVDDGPARITMGQLQHESDYPESWHRVWAVETMISTIYATLNERRLSGDVLAINLSYSKPSHHHIYAETFECPVSFDQVTDEMIFPAHLLDVKQRTHDASVNELALRQCDTATDKLDTAASLLDRVEGIVISSSYKAPSVLTVAERMHLSERTLQRRLGELGTSFREVVNRVQHKSAMDLLEQTNLSVKEIGYLLGYSEASNFSLAFKAMAGVSPANFRRSRGRGRTSSAFATGFLQQGLNGKLL